MSIYNSIELNIELLRRVRACVCDSISGIEPYIDDILKIIDKPIDINKLNQWINQVNFNSKANPISYFKKVFEIEYSKGRFDIKDKPIVNCQSLFNAMRDNHIKVIPDDTSIITSFAQKIIDEDRIKADDLIELNHRLVKQVADLDEEERTSSKYLELLKENL